MGKIKGFFSLISSNIKFKLDNNQINIDSSKILNPKEVNDFCLSLAKQKTIFVSVIDELTTCCLYEKLLIDLQIKKDFSEELYTRFEESLNLEKGTFTFSILSHICFCLQKAFSKLSLAIYYDSPQMRFVIKNNKSDITFLNYKYIDALNSNIPLYLKSKKVMAICKYADLVKIQFIKLKSLNKFRSRFDYSLFALNLKEVIENSDRSNYFDCLDAIKIKLLNYSFNSCLIENGPFSLILGDFVYNLKSSCFILDSSFYSLFDIVKDSKDVPINNPYYLAIENYLENDDDSFKATNQIDINQGDKL